MMNPLDYYDWCYRPYTGSPFEYTSLSAQPLYPPESTMESVAPIVLQQPLDPVRPHSLPLDYRSWCTSINEYLGGAYYCDPSQSMHRTQSKPHPVRASAAMNALEFGPGPPIVTDDRIRGPRGCNLFVFHLPNEMTNWDLYLLFRKHGTILSVHTMINKGTGLSKGYGFVSFAQKDHATAAIEHMNGFRLGKKRLKVQLKRSQDDMGGERDDPHPDSSDASGSTTRASTPQHKVGLNSSGSRANTDTVGSSPSNAPQPADEEEAPNNILSSLSSP